MFNSAQRAHQNTLENLPIVNLMTIAGALTSPRLAALFGTTWVVGRFLYIHGYSTGGPSGRRLGGGWRREGAHEAVSRRREQLGEAGGRLFSALRHEAVCPVRDVSRVVTEAKLSRRRLHLDRHHPLM